MILTYNAFTVSCDSQIVVVNETVKFYTYFV